MTRTYSPDTLDDDFVVPSVCFSYDIKEKDATYTFWRNFQFALIESWREK